jgi:hypothetical protein
MRIFCPFERSGLIMEQRDTVKFDNLSPAPKIVIANNKDSYSSKANEDGFEFTADWNKAASEADVLFLLVPDQVCLLLSITSKTE